MIARLKSPAFLAWLVLALLMVWLSREAILTRSGWDPDDRLRLVQLRDFLAGQGWFDTTQYRMNAPDGAPMHWSRLIELPLALVVLLARPIFGQPIAEMMAGTIIPLACFGVMAWMLNRIVTRLGGPVSGVAAVVMTMVSPAIAMQLRPMRIDHHGWQLFCAALSLWTLFWPSARKAGIVMGLALAVWTHISLEGAPLAAAFFALLAIRWINASEEASRLFWTVASFAVATLLLFFGTQPAGLSAAEYCDTISPAHIAAVTGAAAIMLPSTLWLPDNRGLRLVTTCFAGAAALALLLALSPQCAKGAFGTLDPIVREYWYLRVTEGLPVWRQSRDIALTLLSVPLAGLIAYFALRRQPDFAASKETTMLFGLLVFATIMSLLVFRSISLATLFAAPLVALWIGQLFNSYRTEKTAVRRVSLIALMIVLLMPGAIVTQLAATFFPDRVDERASPKQADESSSACDSVESIAALSSLSKANIVAPFDLGPTILLTTPHKVLASSHHRNQRAMRDHINIFRLPPVEARAIIHRRKITHIAACLGEAELRSYAKIHPDGLWAALAAGKQPSWIVPEPDLGQGIKVWRVR